MKTSINQERVYKRRITDTLWVEPILADVPESVVKTLDFNYIPSDLGALIKLYQTIKGNQKRAGFLRSILDHQNITSETLQALFVDTKLNVEKAAIAAILFTKYPEDTETLIFLLRHGWEYLSIPELNDLKERCHYLTHEHSRSGD